MRRAAFEIEAFASPYVGRAPSFLVTDVVLEGLGAGTYGPMGYDEMLHVVMGFIFGVPHKHQSYSRPEAMQLSHCQESEWAILATPVEEIYWCLEKGPKFTGRFIDSEAFGFIACHAAPERDLYGGFQTYEVNVAPFITTRDGGLTPFVPYALLEDKR